jgi:uncharacterized membrane protein
MNAKQRVLKNWITTAFGTLAMFGALAMLIANRIPSVNIDFSWMEMIGTALFGWVFIMAKDSLIEGLFLSVFKVEAK